MRRSFASARAAAGSLRSVAHVVFVVLAATLIAALSSRASDARESGLPATLQADFMAKLLAYDRNFRARAGTVVHTLVVVKTGNQWSQLAAEEMKSALSRVDRIGDLPHDETIVPYSGADALAAACRKEQVSMVYLTPGLGDEVDGIGAALTGVSVLTVAADPDYVPHAVVLGFDLDSGRPKILVNLEQANRQDVRFPSDVLRLMRIYR